MSAAPACDVVIVGGAVMGSSVAWHLTQDPGFTGRILVIERDPTYADAASSRSTSGFRQQFSTPVNIALSQASAAFLLQADDLLGEGAPAGIGIHEAGYLYLGGPAQVAAFEANHALQRARGVDVALLGPDDLARRYPWMNVEDIAVGSLGVTGEGWFDGYLLMSAFRRRAIAAGVEYRAATARALHRDGIGFAIELVDGERIGAAQLVVTAGIATPSLVRGFGVDLPVTPSKQTVFSFDSPLGGAGMPFHFSPDGLFCRPEGQGFLAGLAVGEEECAADDLEPDHALFDSEVWPRLAHRVPAFAEVRFRGGWAGHYDMSRFDHNPFIGAVPGTPGLFVACGFSGHGIMQSPGVGRALSELVVDGAYRTLDLSDLGVARVAAGRPVHEKIQY